MIEFIMLIVLKNHRITGGLGKKLAERVKDDNSIDNKSHILKHVLEKKNTLWLNWLNLK